MWGLTQIRVKQTSNLKYPSGRVTAVSVVVREYKECFEKADDDDQIAAVDRAATTNVKLSEDDCGDDELETIMLTAPTTTPGHL